MSDDDVVIVGAARTPFGKFGGAMRSWSIPELASLAVSEVLRRTAVAPESVDELVLGVNLPGSDRSVARQALLKAGIPDDCNAYTVDRACCSSLSAVSLATRAIRLGEQSVVVAGGAENMSKVPYFLEDLRWGHRLGDVVLADQLVITCPHTHVPRAVQASEEAARFGIGRAEQDAWALRSQERCTAAMAAGHFDDELFPVPLPDAEGASLASDESPRPETTLSSLARLPTIYGSRTVTPGNAPGLSTGAAALVLMERHEAATRALAPLGKVVATAMVSGDPAKIASIPAKAAQAVLDRAGRCLDEVDLLEINEAFAAVPLVSTAVLGDGDDKRTDDLRNRVNVNGGSIAIGHPTGATGARLIMTLLYELRRRGGGLGLVAICGGIGEGEAVLVEVAGGGAR